MATKNTKATKIVYSRQQLAAFKAWETIRANRAAAEAESERLARKAKRAKRAA